MTTRHPTTRSCVEPSDTGGITADDERRPAQSGDTAGITDGPVCGVNRLAEMFFWLRGRQYVLEPGGSLLPVTRNELALAEMCGCRGARSCSM